jgi:phosphatidylglycerophosphatase A
VNGGRCRDAFFLTAATVGFVGTLPYRLVPLKKWKGGGLLGTAVGWGLVWLLPTNPAAYALACLSMALFAVWVSHHAEKRMDHDDPRIVIDEVAGVWLACAGLPRTPGPMLLAFLFFRVFDVWKGPWGRHSARLPGGWGIVADDLAAALMAMLLLRAVAWGGYLFV